MPPENADELSSLEEARERLYSPHGAPRVLRVPLAEGRRTLPHEWESPPLPPAAQHRGARHVRIASLFLAGAAAFFVVALGVAGYFFYYGGNAVSVNNVTVALQGPTTIAGGDTVPLSIAVTNRNPVAVENATLEIDFPDGTRSADNVLSPYPRYTENLGTIASGQTVTRAVKAVVFGGAGQALSLPVSLSYGASGSNAVFVKKSSYGLSISSTPLSISVSALAEVVSGKPLSFSLAVRSNASVPLDNVVVAATLPFGFSIASSSLPLTGGSFLLGTLAPGAAKTITFTGALTGENNDQRVFHFAVGTASAPGDASLAVSYMSQDATVAIATPFIDTALALNGSPLAGAVLTPGTSQNVSVRYTNTLPTNVTNATVAVTLSGAAIDYTSVQTTDGFYQSATHTVLFSSDTDPALANLAPGAAGLGGFSFSLLPASSVGRSPQVTFTTAVSGTRVGQSNVPEQVSSSATETAKVATVVTLSAKALHSAGAFTNTGPVPPRVGAQTTYTVQWDLADSGSAIGGGTVSATLPSYVSYTGKATSGAITYDDASRTVTWSAGDLAQGGSAEAAFQVALISSSSQRGASPPLTSAASFSGYDRFALVQVSSTVDPVTIETKGDPNYVSADGSVQ